MPVDLATRIRPYGFTIAELQPLLANLTVPRGQQVRLSRFEGDASRHVKQVAPKSVARLKRMMAVPDPARPIVRPVTKSRAVVSSMLSPQLSATEHASLWNAAHNAIYGDTGSVSLSEIAAINRWLSAISPIVFLYFYQDITVEADAQLILSPDVNVLFANNILIQQGGQIICQGSRIKIDCASLTGFDGPPSPGTGTGTGTS